MCCGGRGGRACRLRSVRSGRRTRARGAGGRPVWRGIAHRIEFEHGEPIDPTEWSACVEHFTQWFKPHKAVGVDAVRVAAGATAAPHMWWSDVSGPIKMCARCAHPLLQPLHSPFKFKQKFSPFMTSRQARLQEDTDFRVMRILQENPDISQRDLAVQLGMSLGGLNYCLKALMEKGFVKLDNFSHSTHKLKYAYILTPAGIAQKMAMTGQFLKRKMEEYEALRMEIEVLRAETENY